MHKIFDNTGHAELIHKDPQILLALLDDAYNQRRYSKGGMQNEVFV